MYDFRDISILIHIRIDVDDRLDNLDIVMGYYHANCDNVEFIVVNDDDKPDKRLKSLHKKYGKTSKFLFQDNYGEYHRTRAFNQASKNTDRPFLIAGDTDVIVHPIHILECINVMKGNDKVGGLYPYNGLFLHVKDKHKQTIRETNDIEFLPALVPSKENLVPNYENDDILVAHTESRGGCNLFSHKIWNTIKGYNPNFIGWGAEDDEINHRMHVMGYMFERFNVDGAIAWHLPHHNTVRDNEPFYSRNVKLRDYVSTIKTKQKMKEYITSWSL